MLEDFYVSLFVFYRHCIAQRVCGTALIATGQYSVIDGTVVRRQR